MTTIYIIRHAEADGNLYRRVHGQFDGLVTTRGLKQIRCLMERFRKVKVDAVYASDLYRTRLTSTALTESKGLPLRTDPRLREIHLGDWEDLTWGDVARGFPEEFLVFNDQPGRFQAPGGESMAEVADRIYEAVCDLAARHPNGTIAVVTHGMALRTLMCRWEGKTLDELLSIPHCDNTAVAKVEFLDDGTQKLVYRGDNSHLDETTSTQAGQAWRKSTDTRERFGRNLWFRPLDLLSEQAFFLNCRAEAWKHIHGSMEHYDPAAFLHDAQRCLRVHPKGVQVAMLENTPVGLLQVDAEFSDGKSLHLPFVYMLPETRRTGLGAQLIGEAQAIGRVLGKKQLRLRCSEFNHSAHRFYERLGFLDTDLENGPAGNLLIMTKNIMPLL